MLLGLHTLALCKYLSHSFAYLLTGLYCFGILLSLFIYFTGQHSPSLPVIPRDDFLICTSLVTLLTYYFWCTKTSSFHVIIFTNCLLFLGHSESYRVGPVRSCLTSCDCIFQWLNCSCYCWDALSHREVMCPLFLPQTVSKFQAFHLSSVWS